MNLQHRKPNQRKARLGTFTFVTAALVLVIVICINVIFSLLPVSITEIDLTANRIYTLTDTTKEIVSALEFPIEIYVIAETGKEDSMLRTTLDRYRSLSSKIEVTYVDPLLQPDKVSQLTGGEMTAFLDEEDEILQNSMVIVGPHRYKAVSYYDIGYTDYTPQEIMNAVLTGTTATGVTYYNAESSITAAIDYVTTVEIPKYYVLTGHEESTLPANLASQIGLGNVHLITLDLLTATEIPVDAQGLLLYHPKQDFNSNQVTLLRNFLQKGGDLIFMAGHTVLKDIPNLLGLLEEYGVSAQNNLVYGTTTEVYLQNNPYLLLPQMTSTLTDDYRVALLNVYPLTVSTSLPEGTNVTPIFQTKQNTTELRSIESDSTVDRNGVYTLGVTIEAQTEYGSSKILWIPTEHFVSDSALSGGITPNQAVSGNNERFFLSCLTWMSGKEITVSIDAVRLTPVNLFVTARNGMLCAAVLIFLLPGSILLCGILYQRKRRKR